MNSKSNPTNNTTLVTEARTSSNSNSDLTNPARIVEPALAMPNLPVLGYEEQIKDLIRNYPVAIIIGATGSGKTTEIGRMMSEVISGKIATTQPRRPAAVTVADYVAGKKGEAVGESVGYHVRFNDTTNRGTILDYVTDGILIEQLIATQTLPDYNGIILDEAHIRNLNVDFLMGLMLRVQDKRRASGMPMLKLLITSATIPAEQFSGFFDGAPILEIPGRMYPVEIHYEKTKPKDYITAIAAKVRKVIKDKQVGDILIFVPGEGEIRQTVWAIRNMELGDLEILPFYGQQSITEQDKVFARYPMRKIVVATNIAETSLTIDGVRVVIDVGLQRTSIYDHKTGISRLEDEPASRAAIDQRKGRAGRTAPGMCYRLFAAESIRPEYDIPEILRTDLAGTILKMKRLGIEDVLNFKFIDQPERKPIQSAVQTLQVLGALDEEEHITATGRLMANLPLDPHISRMVVEADRFGCVDAICVIAGFMSSKSVFDRSGVDLEAAEYHHQSFKQDDYGRPLSDQQSFLKVWRTYEQQPNQPQWVTDNYLNPKVLQEITLIHADLLKTLSFHQIQPGENWEPEPIAKSITAGLIGNLLERVNREEFARLVGQGDHITIHPSSALRNGQLPRFIVAGEIMTNAAGFTGAFQCQSIELSWIPEIGRQILREKILESEYSPREDRVQEIVSYHLKRDGRSLVTTSRPVVEATRTVPIFARYLGHLLTGAGKSGDNKPKFEFIQSWQSLKRELSSWHVRSGGEVGELTPARLITKISERLLPLQISSKSSLLSALATGEVNLEFNLGDFLPPVKQATIIKQSPEAVILDGQSCRVEYVQVKGKFQVRVEVPIALALDLKSKPNLPNWQPKAIFIRLVEAAQNHQPVNLIKFDSLRAIAAHDIVLGLWEQGLLQAIVPAEQVISSLELEQIEATGDAVISRPPEITFGHHPITGESLLATPALDYDRRRKVYIWRYFQNPNNARQAQERAMRQLNLM